ncbi:hypothetical protein B0T18DRAFT_330745 [Schizothecium vesticola]|uniref:Uncharacterized protein n=1 Tax=Schizothecium vesticola TaxID=314040 RepID=A0AA40ELF0_9PEZI|nr:hypothetical protein B0T18DRAFT_330745 [Schizothecium vesticola]
MPRSPADDQDTSTLFSRLPLEIRRLIYLEVWRDYVHFPGQPGVPGLRLHLYNDGLEDAYGVLRHARCLVHKGSPAEHDSQIMPSPFETTHGSYAIPTWYLFAWHLRKHWGNHWKCQSAIMQRWVPATGAEVAPERSPFLAVFLTCKKMYWEAIASLFNHTTLVFTSSEDAYRFFVHDQHPFADGVRSLELNFTNPNDHLFLAPVQRETPACDAADEPNEAEPGTSTVVHVFSRIEVFGPKMWAELLQGLQAATPGLRDLDIVIGGRLQRDLVLDAFGGSGPDGDVQDQLTDQKEESGWAIPGRVEVMFTTDGLRYLQHGRKMVAQR